MKYTLNTGAQLAMGLVLCGAVLIGTILSDDNEQTTLSSRSIPVVSHSVSFSNSPARVSSPVVVMPSSPAMSSKGRSAGGASSFSYTRAARTNSTILVSAPSSRTSAPMGGGGGGATMGASSSSSVVSSSSSASSSPSSGGYAGGGYTTSVPMVLFAPGAKAVVVAPPTTIPSGFMGTGENTQPPLYEGDAPGIIPGQDGDKYDDENPIVTCYGLPIGDTLWPLLLLALLYVSFKLLTNKRKKETTSHSMLTILSHILSRRQRSTAEVSSCSSASSHSRTLACALAMCALCTLFSTRAWAGQEEWNGKTYNVVYLSSTGTGTGDSRETPVNTWAKAYKKLTNTSNRDYDWEHNIIVIVGDMQINYKEGDTKDKSNKQGTAATITGVWPWNASDSATITDIKNGGQAKITGIDNNIGADVRFRNVRIQGDGGLQDRLSLRLHSTCFDEGLVMMGFAELGKDYGMIVGRSAPALHIQLSFDQISGSEVRPSHVVYEMPGDSAMTVIFKSGKYGRIAVSRTQGNLVTTNYVQGTPNHPVMAHVIVDIQDGNDNTGGYYDDISIMLGGSSQGFVCADLQYDLKHGTIGTMVAGSQGNNVAACVTNKIPAETFAGRTQVNVGVENGGNGDFTIQTYYGGTQGRATTSGSNASAYFYGESEFNMYSGTIKAGVFSSATAFSGLRYENDHNIHTPDYAIPYVDANNDLAFGSYKESGKMGVVKSSFRGNVDLSTTKITLNIYGGVIEGGIYGGSRGYEPLISAQYAPDNCGTHFGDTEVNVYGGTIKGGVYGGGLGTKEYYDANQKDGFLNVAQVFGNTHVNIYGGDIQGNIYGGGYGIASNNTKNYEYIPIAKVFGSTSVTINPTDPNWTFTGNIYGGGALSAVEGSTNVQVLGGIILGNVYAASQGEVGHPNKGKIGGAPSATIAGGTISQNVYGGGQLAPVEGDPLITLAGGTISRDIYGGGDEAPVTGNPLVEAQFGSVNDIFAGGRGATAIVTGNPKAYINKTDNETLTVRDVYGGGDAANVVGTANVQLDNGTVATVYGGGNAANVTNTAVVINGGQATMAFAGGHGDKDAAPQKEANVTGDAQLTIHGGTVGKAFAGSNSKGSIAGAQTLLINKTGDALAELHVTEAYGGGNQADGKAGTIEVGCTGGETEGVDDLFGGAREANITNDINLTLEAGKIGRIFGGNNVSGNVAGTITVNIAENITKYDCGLHIGSVYGGGQDAAYAAPEAGAYPVVNINGGSIANDVFGGGLGVTAVVTGSPVVTVNGGTVSGSVYGGGALANVTGNTTVNLTGGTIGNSYGGGLGSNEVAALVSGNATTTLNGSKVTGSIFGANNVNGTPKGHVKVHVLSTAKREGQADDAYDVAAVYGGGNQAAYEPTSNEEYTEVLIENCSNSIDYVYGGGNAAPVPATSVTIYGANAINNAFAGGNGAGDDNPGADVGYNGYYSQTAGETETYGSGESHITVYGGTVNNVYGGSNTLGYIRTHAYVDIMTPPDDYEGEKCDLHVGNTYAGGNQAAMFCGGSMTLACSEGADVVYAGANSADIYGDIDLVINSGTYGKVFGGNNIRGNVYGHININIDETGCYPIMIGELYGGGNEAAYSVYGYYKNGDDDANEDNIGKPRTSGTKLYDDPTINIISFTGIGRVFGGGKGEAAVVYGNPTININPIKGVFAGQHPQPLFVLNNSYERIRNDHELNIPDAVGKIAAVYGGGNAAAVYGNTTVNIGNQAQNHHLTPGAVDQPVDAIIAGNIYGGGSKADINGNTHVNIQIGIVLGDVYGGGEGVEGDASKAKVTGTTKVTIGE